MHLSRGFAKILLVIVFCISSSVLYAYDYPVVGEFNSNYQRVFDSIEAGRCDSMNEELTVLSKSEGISPFIYLAVCYMEAGDNDKAFKTMDSMLAGQEYDEVLYVTGTYIDKGGEDARLIKYRGLAYFNIGAYRESLTDLESYLKQNKDDKVVYSIVDMYVALQNYDRAALFLEKAENKDGRYFYRKGRIYLRDGKIVSALKNLRMVNESDEEVYPSAKMLIAEICASTNRFICAEKEYTQAASSEAYADSTKERLERLSERKKLFSGFLSLGGQYDTNVTSIDEDELPGASEVDSFRTYAMADLKLNFYPAFADTVSVGTMHYATWNRSIPSYDMSTHKVYLLMKHSYDQFEIMLPKITAGITYFDDERYSTAVSVEASGSYKLDTWRFTIPVKVTRSNYENNENSADTSKDGFKYETSLQVVKNFLRKYTLKAAGGYGVDDTTGKQREKKNYTFDTALSVRVTKKLTPTLGFNYAKYDYDKISREDEYYSASLKAVYLLTPQIFLGGGVTWTKTDSNENAYDYSKTVSELSVSYSF